MKNININQTIKNKGKYQTPKLKKIGNIRNLTLKSGSQSDVFGGTYTP